MPTVRRIRSGFDAAGTPFAGSAPLTSAQQVKLDNIAQSGAFATLLLERAKVARIEANIAAQQARLALQQTAVARAESAVAALIDDEFSGVNITAFNGAILTSEGRVDAISVERS